MDAGFLVNLRKCRFLVERFDLLGHEVDVEGVPTMRLAEKTVLGWTDLTIPRNITELQGLLGRLQWASSFVPRFKSLVAPIEQLLSARTSFRWTPCCTDALNELVRHVHARLRLRLPSFGDRCRLYPVFDHETSAAYLTQGSGDQECPVAIVSARASTADRAKSEVERLVAVVDWATRKLSRYIANAPTTTVVYPTRAVLQHIGGGHVH